MIPTFIWFVLYAALCVFGCYFAACTIALRTVSRSRFGELLEQWGRQDRFEPFISRRSELQLVTATVRAFLTLAIVLLTLYLIELESSLRDGRLYTAAFLVAALSVSVFIVAIPVSWARYRPELLLARSMTLLEFCLAASMPIVRLLHLFDPVVRRISGADVPKPDDDEAIEALSDEVMSVVEDHENTDRVDTTQKQMIEAVFDFATTTAEQIMTPRIEIEGLDINASLDQVKHFVQTEGHSRIPVHEGDLDHIVGILYVKDLVQYLGNGDMEGFHIRQVMRDPVLVPETKPVRELLNEFKAGKVHLAILLDEYGGTAGLITIEDVLEELVGEIQDEYEPDAEAPMIREIDDITVEVDARVHVDDVNDQLDLDLPEADDYDTIGGLVVATLGHIPDEGETLELESIRMTVTNAERTRVNRVRIERLTPAGTPGDGDADS